MSDIEYSVIKSDVIKSFDCIIIWPSKISNGPQKMLKAAKHGIGPQNSRPGGNIANGKCDNSHIPLAPA